MSIADVATQYADLIALAPFLCPRVQPRSLIDCDLKAWKAGATAGTQDQLDTRLERVAAQTTHCSVCGRRGAAVTGDDDEGSDEERETAAADAKSELRFTTQWRLQVQDRECQLTGGSFCCGMCRTCMDIGAFVQFCSFRAGRPECREWDGLAGELVQHMVAVNQITTLPTAAEQMVFVQEVICRAYALHVLVSSVTGWKVTHAPDGASEGTPLSHGSAEDAVRLLDSLFPAPKAKSVKKGAKSRSKALQ